jgi:hypothetical protein
MGNQPMAKVKIGSVEVAVWENKSENKLIWHSVTIQRHYKSGGEWKNTSNFRLRDIKDILTALEKVKLSVYPREASSQLQRNPPKP